MKSVYRFFFPYLIFPFEAGGWGVAYRGKGHGGPIKAAYRNPRSFLGAAMWFYIATIRHLLTLGRWKY